MSLKNSSVASKIPKTLEKNLNHKRIKKIYKNFDSIDFLVTPTLGIKPPSKLMNNKTKDKSKKHSRKTIK